MSRKAMPTNEMGRRRREHPSPQSKGGGEDISRSERAMALEKALRSVVIQTPPDDETGELFCSACGSRWVEWSGGEKHESDCWFAALSPASEGGSSAGKGNTSAVLDHEEVKRSAIQAVDAWLDEVEGQATRRERFVSQTPAGATAWLYSAAVAVARALSPKEPTDG